MTLRLAHVFSDNMILQQGLPVALWGWAAPGAVIRAEFQNQRGQAMADEHGRWKLMLPTLMSSDRPGELSIAARSLDGSSERCGCVNVLVGEVWLCAGQSNMEWPLAQSRNAETEIAAPEHPAIRQLNVPKQMADQPRDEISPTRWEVCSPQTAGSFSAVGYYFARELQRVLGAPIGLICSTWGGTTAEAWTSCPSLLAQPSLGDMFIEGKAKPSAMPGGRTTPHKTPGVLFNAMIAPLAGYGIRGVIWYQGEANANTSRGRQYRVLFPTLIEDWRKQWGRADLPFHFVQLPNFMAANEKPQESQWALLREAQLMALALPHTGMAVTIDIGEARDLHPPNKRDVGLRLAYSALHQTYGKKEIAPSGPLLRQGRREGSTFRLWFDHTEGGLVGRGSELKGFVLAGEDEVFHPAQARIEGETVVVSSAEVVEPRAARYAWAANPENNLYNGAGLPASPARTDRD